MPPNTEDDTQFDLSPEQVKFFYEQGYLSIDALTTQDEVAWLREIYDRLFRERAGRDEGRQFDLAGTDEEGKEAALPQILSPAKYAPELLESQLLKNVSRLVKILLGEDANASFAHAIFKPAKFGAETPWHQDASYWSPAYLHRSVSIWVPLQEATPENGCMEFVPRSHLDHHILAHQSINNDPRIHGLELRPEEMGAVKDAVACPLPPGGGTIHGGYMLHHTGPNKSEVPRRAIILGGSVPALKLEKPRRYPWLEEKQTARMQRAENAQPK